MRRTPMVVQRPSRRKTVVPGGTMKALAVDFGGSHASCGLVDNRRLIAFEEIDLTGATKLVTALPEVAECFRRLLAANGAMAADCAGIAMGLPSIVDAR